MKVGRAAVAPHLIIFLSPRFEINGERKTHGAWRWRHLQILLLRMVFMYPREDARVQAAAMEVLKHCSTSTALLGMSIEWVPTESGFPEHFVWARVIRADSRVP
jgi:hypothetical protein